MHIKCTALALTVLVVTFVAADSTQASFQSTAVPDFNHFYGGFAGAFTESTTYDFGTAFPAVLSASLHLEGDSVPEGSTVTFDVDLEGVTTPTWNKLVGASTTYSVDIPLLFDSSVLDGTGPIELTIHVTKPGYADLGTTISNAVLTFEIPEPSTFAISVMALAGTACRRARRRH